MFHGLKLKMCCCVVTIMLYCAVIPGELMLPLVTSLLMQSVFQEKFEWWWLYVADKRNHFLISAPVQVTSLKEEETVSTFKLKFIVFYCTCCV